MMPEIAESEICEAPEISLFEEANGNVLEGYLLVKSRNLNIPRAWFERYQTSRRNRQEAVVVALQAGDWAGIETLRDWDEAFSKECFYYGIRVLLELERKGKSDW